MKLDAILPVDDLAAVAGAARELEAAGFDGAWTAEVGHDPFLPHAVAAVATERLGLGTSIAVAFARSPMTMAYTAHDLQAASHGRFILGLGSQIKAHITRRFSMPWGKPAAQMREYILALRAIWASWDDGRPLDFHRYQGMEHDRFILRSVTDEVMYEIMKLSGQEYVDIYATAAKRQIADEAKRVADEAKRKADEAKAGTERPGG